MFYEVIGGLLSRASEGLAEGDAGRRDDERGRRAFRQVTTMLRRLGAIWPQLFAALEEESELLRQAWLLGRAALREHGVEIAAEEEAADPLVRYAQLQRNLDAVVIALHRVESEAWARAALVEVRRGLARAAAVQGRLVDDMLAA